MLPQPNKILLLLQVGSGLTLLVFGIYIFYVFNFILRGVSCLNMWVMIVLYRYRVLGFVDIRCIWCDAVLSDRIIYFWNRAVLAAVEVTLDWLELWFKVVSKVLPNFIVLSRNFILFVVCALGGRVLIYWHIDRCSGSPYNFFNCENGLFECSFWPFWGEVDWLLSYESSLLRA